MAKMFPKVFPRFGEPDRWAEEQVFRAFSQLDEEWTILYSVPWQSLRDGRQGDGEADFVLLHPKSGIFVGEVKGGTSIELENGKWFTTNRNGKSSIKNPFEQAVESKHMFFRYLKQEYANFPRSVTLGHFVVFPSAPCDRDLGPGGPRAIIIDKADLVEVDRAIDRVAAHWNNPQTSPAMSLKQVKEICSILSPVVQIKTLLRDEVRDINSALTELTNAQINAMRFLRHQRRALVTGVAGTGKTVLAMARAKELAAGGFRTLLVCFNHPLGQRLKVAMSGNELITAGSFHSVCKEMCEKYAELPPGPIDSKWWNEDLPAMFVEAVHDGNHKYDAIVVDEAQDFLDDWWSYLELAFRDTGNEVFCVFADSNQNIYRPGWTPPIDGDPFELEINCRNTVEIASRTNALLDYERETLGVHGLSPIFKEASTHRQIEKLLLSSAMKLLSEDRLDPKQIAILTSSRDEVERLRISGLDGLRLSDLHGDSILIETIYRFKGLEADAVILILHDDVLGDARKLAYVGMSRARVILQVIGSHSIKETLKWDG